MNEEISRDEWEEIVDQTTQAQFVTLHISVYEAVLRDTVPRALYEEQHRLLLAYWSALNELHLLVNGDDEIPLTQSVRVRTEEILLRALDSRRLGR